MVTTRLKHPLLLLALLIGFGAGLGLGRAPLPPPRPVSNVPVTVQASEPVKVNELELQVLAGGVWPVPAAGGLSPLQLQLRVTNRGKDHVSFLPILGQPILQTPDGNSVVTRCLGGNGLRRLPDRVTIEPGKSFTVTEPAQLFASPGGSRLSWMDETGSVWSSDDLPTGKYLLSLQYTSTGRNGEWVGKGQTAALAIEIRDLKASPSGTANALEVWALADGTWRVPAEGKQTRIDLGFRIANARKPAWARIFPCISAVSIKSADGKEHLANRAATVPAEGSPPALHMEPDVSRTLAQPALLFHSGQALALTWVDSAGTVWQFEGLKPGKYTVRYTIQAQKGKTPAEWTTWVGEIQTAALEVEITSRE
jgi:hypothetical protein